MTVGTVAAWAGLVVGVAAALTVLWRIIRTVGKASVKWEKLDRILANTDQLVPDDNGGRTLANQINSIESEARAARNAAHTAVDVAAATKRIAEATAALAAETADDLGRQLLSVQTIVRRSHKSSEAHKTALDLTTTALTEQTAQIEKYVHDRFHELANAVQKLILSEGVDHERLESLMVSRDQVAADIARLMVKADQRRATDSP